MTGWTEATLRAAASWKSFKEGKGLFESGAVVEAQAGHAAWRGALRAGKRLLRVSVAFKSTSDLETRCSCPENQMTGELCAHAVAVGLAVLARGVSNGGAAEPAQKTTASPAQKTVAVPAQKVSVRAREIFMPPNWREAWKRGKLAATVTLVHQAEVTPADHGLATWLASEGVADKESLTLHLDGQRGSAFLVSLAGHPRVVTGKDRSPVIMLTGQRFPLASAEMIHDEVCLIPTTDTNAWCEIGGTFWQIGADFLGRAGAGTVPGSLAGILGPLARGNSVRASVRQLLEHLESWQDWLVFPDQGWLESLHFIPAAASFHLALDGTLEHLHAQLMVAYGDSAAVPLGHGSVKSLPRLINNHCEIRDHASEERAATRLTHAGFDSVNPTSGHWELRGEPAILNFLTRILPQIRDSWRVTEATRFHHHSQQVALVSPHIEILGSGEDWLGFNLSFQTTDGTDVSAADVRQLLRSGRTTTKLAGGRRLVVSDDLAELIDPLFSELDLQQKGGHFEASARSAEVILEIRKKLHNTQTSSGLHEIKPFVLPASLRADLRPYQSQGAAWLLDRVKRFGGALLADDMGLGKTLQAIALMEHLLETPAPDSGLVLVVATTSLLGNWRAEIGRFAPARRVRILHGTGRDAERDRVTPGDVILTSYGTLTRDLAWHLKRDYRAVVVDEASLMRNPDTDHARAVSKLRTSARIALTGTPVENGVRDLWSVFRFVQPGWLGGREDFRERYELPLAEGASTGAVMERLKLKIQPFLLRRTKEQVAPELPSKLFIDEFCDLSPDQQAVYRELLIEGRKRVDAIADSGNPGAARMQMLTALLRLRQTCCDLALFGNDRFNRLVVARRSAKLQRLLELLDEAQSGNHKVLVFSQFQKQLLEIEKCVIDRGWGCLRLDGQTRNRQQLVETFQDPHGPPVFLISLKAGGYGLNLTAADTVIHFDPWWNPAAEMQATDRAHRIGQTRPVTVYRLLTRGTVEEKVVRLQARKRELAASIDETGAGDAPGWTMGDFKTLISND